MVIDIRNESLLQMILNSDTATLFEKSLIDVCQGVCINASSSSTSNTIFSLQNYQDIKLREYYESFPPSGKASKKHPSFSAIFDVYCKNLAATGPVIIENVVDFALILKAGLFNLLFHHPLIGKG